jgi:PAT family beta-lactamase induction signal transducer AmpG
MTHTSVHWRQAILSPRMLICICTGFASGLPLYLLINLLPAWLRSEGVDLKAIGLFALIGLPYTWKFLWSPLLDRFVPPLLGRRRGWMLLSQLALLVSMALFGLFDPRLQLQAIAALAAVVAEAAALARKEGGTHPAWVVAAPLIQVKRGERGREGEDGMRWTHKTHPPLSPTLPFRSPSLPPASCPCVPWPWPTGPALRPAAPSGPPTSPPAPSTWRPPPPPWAWRAACCPLPSRA